MLALLLPSRVYQNNGARDKHIPWQCHKHIPGSATCHHSGVTVSTFLKQVFLSCGGTLESPRELWKPTVLQPHPRPITSPPKERPTCAPSGVPGDSSKQPRLRIAWMPAVDSGPAEMKVISIYIFFEVPQVTLIRNQGWELLPLNSDSL